MSNIESRQEGRFEAFLWAVNGMESHRINKVIFAINDACVVGLVTRPKRWPLFKFQSLEIMKVLAGTEWWRVLIDVKTTNREADRIAQNVPNQRTQSYVAVGWMYLDIDQFDRMNI